MVIYKYYRPNQTYFFDNLMARFTQPDALNDPFDCLPRIKDNDHDIIEHMTREKYIRSLMDCPASKQKLVTKKWEEDCKRKLHDSKKNTRLLRLYSAHQVKRNISNRFGVFSASKCSDNVLMWAHYAENHAGFVVAMDSSHDFFKGGDSVPKNLRGIKCISYKKRRASVCFSTNDLDPEIMLIKSQNWMYEEEVRLIRPLSLADKTEEKSGEEWPIKLFLVPAECIRFVIFGFKSTASMCDEIQSKAKDNPQLKHLKFYGAEVDPDAYLVHKRPYTREQTKATGI